MYSKENLTKINKMNELAPEVMKAFWAFDKLAVAEGVIPVKYKELIAFALALTTQCPYCIEIHNSNARKAGATDAGAGRGGDGCCLSASRGISHSCDSRSVQLSHHSGKPGDCGG